MRLEWKALNRNHLETGGPDHVAELMQPWPPTGTHSKEFCKLDEMRPAFESVRPDLRIGIAGLGHVARAVLAGQLAMDIGPELLYHDRNGVVPNLCSPYAGTIRKGAIGCIVNISRRAFRVVTNRDEGSGMVAEGGDCGRQGTPKNFRVVELWTAGIGTGDKDSADRITGPVRESTFARLEKAGILMQE